MNARLLTTLALFVAMASATPTQAELVVLTDGAFFKVRAFEVRGDRLQMSLWDGGGLTLSMGRVERIVDDEWVPPPPAPPPVVIVAVERESDLEWRFAEDHEVPETPFGAQIFAAAKNAELNPEIVAAVIRAESAFNPRAVSHKGALGLMQLMPATAKRFGVTSRKLFDPPSNLEAGTRYLRFLFNRYPDDPPKALAAYNAGEGAVDRYGGVPPYRETQNYLKRIYGFLGLGDPL